MRLLSYNIHKGIGGLDRRYDLDRIVRVIEHTNPDLVCLQEVTKHASRTRGDDQPDLLSKSLVLETSLFQMNVHYRKGGYGNLMLSRWPFRTRHNISLRHGSRKPRGGQIVVVETPEGLLRIAHFHLGLVDSERKWQANHLLEHSLFQESEGLPTIVVGDCNDWRNRLSAEAFEKYGYTQVTTPPSRFRSFPAFLPTISLDKAFHLGLHISEAMLIRNPMSHRASDHLPLVVDFHLHERYLR